MTPVSPDNPWLIVGLGNPGSSYKGNRHNVGFQVLDTLADRYAFPAFQVKNQACFTKKQFKDGPLVYLLKPMTFMNLSGRSVGPFARFYHIPLNQLWVVHDDLDLAPGKVKIKQGGGTGGHRGLESLDGALGKAYHRLRIGIGHPGRPERVANYVLEDFSPKEDAWHPVLLGHLVDFFPLLLENKPEVYVSKVMQAMTVLR